MRRRFFSWLMVLGLCAGTVWAQGNFVYTNNDTVPNTVSGFAVGKDGRLTEVPGSPFRTGGNGAPVDRGRFFASNRIRVVGNFVYASNVGSHSVSGFSIDPETGSLTLVPGSPFPTGGVGDLDRGLSLAAAAEGQFLYAGNDFSRNIRVFRIGPEGELTPVGDLVPAGREGLNAMAVSPDGQWLSATHGFDGPHGMVSMFSIEPKTGTLTAVKGSPFALREPGGPDGRAAGVDINCASDALFVGEGRLGRGTTLVDVLSIDPDTGALTAIEGSPFDPGVGINSNVPLLSPDDLLLFVSNQGEPHNGSVVVLTVDEKARLALVKGSPFMTYPDMIPAGMATGDGGAFLHVAGAPDLVDVFGINPGGSLASVAGSPFSTRLGVLASMYSVAAFPAKTCPAAKKPYTRNKN